MWVFQGMDWSILLAWFLYQQMDSRGRSLHPFFSLWQECRAIYLWKMHISKPVLKRSSANSNPRSSSLRYSRIFVPEELLWYFIAIYNYLNYTQDMSLCGRNVHEIKGYHRLAYPRNTLQHQDGYRRALFAVRKAFSSLDGCESGWLVVTTSNR